jgi:hypothetical protein
VLNARLSDELGRPVGTDWRVDSLDPAALAASLQTVFLLLVPWPQRCWRPPSRLKRCHLGMHPRNEV